MTTIDQIRRDNLALLRDEAGGVKALADRVGVAESQMSQWLNGSAHSKSGKPRGMRSDSARRIEAAMDKPEGWLDIPHPPRVVPNGSSGDPVSDDKDKPEVAQLLSHWALQTVPSMTWEQLVSEDRKGTLPHTFRVGMPDNSMSPRVPQGAMLVMSTKEQPQPGDGVLVKDKAGSLHFRQYREIRPGSWEAHAFNQAYGVLESERDGLKVLAVMMALESRGL